MSAFLLRQLSMKYGTKQPGIMLPVPPMHGNDRATAKVQYEQQKLLNHFCAT